MAYKAKIAIAQQKLLEAELNKMSLVAARWRVVIQIYTHLLTCPWKHSASKSGRMCTSFGE